MKTSLFDRFADPGTQLTACIVAYRGPLTGSNRVIRTPGWAAAGKLPSHGLPGTGRHLDRERAGVAPKPVPHDITRSGAAWRVGWWSAVPLLGVISTSVYSSP